MTSQPIFGRIELELPPVGDMERRADGGHIRFGDQ